MSSARTQNTIAPGNASCDSHDAMGMVDELSRAADGLKWTELPETGALRKMADLATVVGYFSLEDVLDTAVEQRGHLYGILTAQRRRGWA